MIWSKKKLDKKPEEIKNAVLQKMFDAFHKAKSGI